MPAFGTIPPMILTRACTLLCISLLAGLAVVSSAHAQKCPSKGQFKGIELYSWPVGESWRFAMVPGTNRAKPAGEIKGHPCTGNADEMAAVMTRLGDGQLIFWFHRKIPGFTYPPDAVIDRVVASARQAGVDLHGPPRESDASPVMDIKRCKEWEGQLNQRHAELVRAKESAEQETALIQRESAELATQLRSINSSDRDAVAAHNARAAEHNRRSIAHNQQIVALNEQMAAHHSESTEMLASCSGRALKLPKLEPAPGK